LEVYIDHPEYFLRFSHWFLFTSSSIGRSAIPVVNLLPGNIVQKKVHKSIPATISTSETQVTGLNDDIG
jgi:hypothetical protein